MRRTCSFWLCTSALCLLTLASVPWASADQAEATIATERPTRWMPSKRRRCGKSSKSRRNRTCNGPRRTPEPYGKAADVAEELGLGTHKTAMYLMGHSPKEEWVEATRGKKRRSMLWPVEHGRFGRGFGFTRTNKPKLQHDGVDIGAESGDLVRAVNDAIVAYSDNSVRGYGNMLMLIHADESVTFYCHHRANYVFAGQRVRRGQVVGEVGSTGISRGPHLHFEYHVRGKARDPMRRMIGMPSRNGVPADRLLQL